MNYTYPTSYKIKPIKGQVKILQQHFGKMPLQNGSDLSEQAEGIFAIPHYRLIATTYNEAVVRVMEIIKATRPVYDYRSGNWTGLYLRQLPIKQDFWNAQKEEIILISSQFGLSHRGKSVETVRTELSSNELPFGIYECLIMLLTHPERLQDYDDLWIDCPGDEYSDNGDAVFGCAPCVRFRGGGVGIGALDVSNVSGFYGSASGFVPQLNVDSGSLGSFEPLNLDSAIKIIKDAGYVVYKPL